jgi:Uma2 family endonuclease
MKRVDVCEYLAGQESMRPMELLYGVVREPPAPKFGHQSVLTHLGALMDAHVRKYGLGRVSVAPVDVILDVAAALVVQPDIVFVAADRLEIVRDRVFGAPDLVVEVLSPKTARRDRTTKIAMYAEYGVQECWLADLKRRTIEVVDLQSDRASRTFSGAESVRSAVFPAWEATADEIFA